ncbi:YncE family protein [Polaromonas naphthalenivorans]|nr:YncE family protein [Polaromonas naphthalenivorans]
MKNFPCRDSRSMLFSWALPRCRTALRCLIGALWLGAAAAFAAPLAYLADRNQNTVSVVEMTTYSRLTTISLGAAQASPVELVANEASGKVFVALGTGVAIIDPRTQALAGEIPLALIKAMAVSPDGKKVYALTPGSVSVIDTDSKSVTATLAVDPSAVSLAIDADGETIYVAHTGLEPGTENALGAAGITLINGLTPEIENVVSTKDFRPERLAVNPGDDRLYMLGNVGLAADEHAYRMLDPVTSAITRIALVMPPQTPPIPGFTSLAFNQDGSRLYLGGHSFGVTTIPVLEVDTAAGTVARVLRVPPGFADEHTALKLATSFANDKFVLIVFVKERLNSAMFEPGRRAVFMEVAGGLIVSDFQAPSPGDTDLLTGDILDSAPAPTQGKVPTSTVLQANANPPLRPTLPVTFMATVTGNNPTGKVVFRFTARGDHHRMVQKVRVPLNGGVATLALAACNTAWDNAALQKIACSPEFKVVAKFRGDPFNARSKSEALHESY